METLKKVLFIMVVILVVLIGAGGYLAVNMGHMNMASNSGTGQKQNNNSSMMSQDSTHNNSKQEDTQNKNNENSNNQSDQSSDNSDIQGNQNSNMNNGTNQTGNEQQGKVQNQPVLIPVPQTPKTDPQVYVEQLKERLKAVNEANNSIAGKSGGQSAIVQQNGSLIQPSPNNQLNLDFYKLGQNMASMEQSLNDLSKSIAENQQYGSVPYNPYVYPQYPGTGYYPYSPYSQYQGQYPTYQLPNQNGQSSSANGSMNDGNNMTNGNGMTNSNGMGNMNGMQMNSNQLGNLLNAGNIKLVFTMILLASVVLAIVSVIGFISSLFKRGQHNNSAENQINI